MPAYTLPAAAADALGGIKAAAATETDTVPAKIGADGILYVPAYPVLPVAATTEAAGIVSMAAAQTDSTATTFEGFVTEFNTFLGKLRTAGILAAEA